eukprot:CAMPEP_0119055834 /NCGR_PEP_ID=MMETSP1178-20130426/469_1 /TAXON_ID=33656 /ORGANISM="unid sp, Strain CCMP2000" /LENGTH=658 /DNA_ID=CAMNT_0007036479 /DNA_START=67 /DNA_END=2043 /DNA_ORIENTATION=+
MANIIVKITDGKDIRRFTASNEISYSTIHKKASESFGLGAKDFKLKYKDDEGDLITMSTDSELADAVTFTKTLEPPVLRLTLEASRTCNEGTTPKSEANTAAESPDMAALFQNIKQQLPALVEQLPEAVKTMLPNMEVDLSASAAATAAAAASAAAAADAAASHAHAAGAYGHAHPAANPDMEGFHPEVECDKTGQCPIIGTRFHLKGHNWDLCAAEFAKLPESEKAQFEAIEPPCYRLKSSAGRTSDTPKGFHPGVTCDKTGQCPIFGWRFHLSGQNYDLCEAEFNKLPEAEKAGYEKIAPPWPCWSGRGGVGRGCGKGFGGGWGCGWEASEGTEPGKGFCKGKGKGMHSMHDGGKPAHKLLAARFVCDVSIFDGTQMAPGTKFTKIWRLKNTGEVPWPAGTQIMFVGGDQMAASLTVPLSRQAAVLPGEEVDVAVDLVAPQEHGRYVGYWRLTGPMGRRKWGQRVWAHIHVVDPQAEPQPPTEREILEMRAATSDREKDDDGGEDDGAVAEEEASEDGELVIVPPPETEAPSADEIVSAMSAATVNDTSKTDAATGAAPAAAPLDATMAEAAPQGAVAEALGQMGFVDAELVQFVVERNGPDLDACVRDLTTLNENEAGLRDLAEMGFPDAKLNAKLLIKNAGSVKNTVRDLVTEM